MRYGLTMSSVQDFRKKRLQQALDEKFEGNRSELGRALGYTSGAFVRQMLDEERPITEKTVEAIEALPGRGLKGWFDPAANRAAVETRVAISGATDNPSYVLLPLLAEAAAGPGREPPADGEVVQQVEVLESYLRESLRVNPSRLRLMTARGHSMHGVVEDGDVLFVMPCSAFDVDGLYVLTVDGLLRVKRLRLRITDRQLSIESTDGSAPELVPLSAVGDTVLIQGRVVGAWGLKKL